jgi:arginase
MAIQHEQAPAREDRKVVIVGIPFDQNSSYQRGAADGPAAIRNAFKCESSNSCSELGMDTNTCSEWTSLSLNSDPSPFETITRTIRDIRTSGAVPISLGGDHSITFPIIQAFADVARDLTILHFDAHPDLYDSFEGDRNSHACPFARIMEASLAKRLVQVGIRTMNEHQRKQAERFGVEVLEMRQWEGHMPALDGPLYVSFDMDVLDPAYCPGVSHPEPGGLTTREVIREIHDLSVPIVGADIVELNPANDQSGISAMCAAKILKELIGKIAAG